MYADFNGHLVPYWYLFGLTHLVTKCTSFTEVCAVDLQGEPQVGMDADELQAKYELMRGTVG